ncbi:multiple sugar transport system permease protein [Nakamurella sp. UYEF19]|uniref:carbohydrate ABC transporter permease n=1 Tax=Nakamurella sp. UYEF19 TaxID=1756392 RepID=UPI0033936B2D
MSSITQEPALPKTPPAPKTRSAPPVVSKTRRSARPYLLSVPAVLLIIGILVPFIKGIILTFQGSTATTLKNPPWVGFKNFARVLNPDSSVFIGHATWITIQYAVLATVIETVLGVGVALLLNRSTLIGRIFEKVLILPLMIAPAIAATVWKFMFNADFGVLNHVLGLGNFNWLSDSSALYSAVLVDIWIYTPFVAILVLAGIRSLPKEPFEASAVDDAGPIYMFRRLMLPLIWPYILVAVIFRFMDCLKIFDIPYVLTGGGPGVATTTLQINAFNDLIKAQQYSRGTTYMFILWVLVFITARLLVGVLGKAQARAAGAEE